MLPWGARGWRAPVHPKAGHVTGLARQGAARREGTGVRGVGLWLWVSEKVKLTMTF